MRTINMTNMLVKNLVYGSLFFIVITLGGSAAAALLSEDTQAPDFTLKAHDGRDVTLSEELKRGNVVLYFYPKNNTPGCTKQACSFRDMSEEFRLAGAAIFGINTDSVESHKKFHKKNNLTFTLLSDSDGRVAKLYGARSWFRLARRVTFVIDTSGTIRKVYPNVDISSHAAELLQEVRKLNEEKEKP
jgi:thioredoxin-dependent peroxiredoxin